MTPDSHTLTVPLEGKTPEDFERLAEQAVKSYFSDLADVRWTVNVKWDTSCGPPRYHGTVIAFRAKRGVVLDR